MLSFLLELKSMQILPANGIHKNWKILYEITYLKSFKQVQRSHHRTLNWLATPGLTAGFANPTYAHITMQTAKFITAKLQFTRHMRKIFNSAWKPCMKTKIKTDLTEWPSKRDANAYELSSFLLTVFFLRNTLRRSFHDDFMQFIHTSNDNRLYYAIIHEQYDSWNLKLKNFDAHLDSISMFENVLR